MPDKPPFEVDPYAPTEERIDDAQDLLRPIEPDETRGVLEQLIANAEPTISTTEVGIKSSAKF